MEPLNAMDELARRARLERPPEMNVTAAVQARIRAEQDIPDVSFGLCAIGSAAAAAAVVLASGVWSAWHDSLAALFYLFQGETL